MRIVLTGAAGFIGFHLAQRLLAQGDAVIGVDDMNAYYDIDLKAARASRLADLPGFTLHEMDVAAAEPFAALVRSSGAEAVIHLAAQAGVRHSLENPFAYQHANLAGHLSVLEACRHAPSVGHLIYASSSSVYGDRAIDGAFSEDDLVDAPASLYAATKRADELMSSAYSKLYGLAQTGLRFFTVYGPWGRPDMAYFIFTQKIMAGEPISVFGEGRMARDFTYIDDVVDGVLGVLARPAAKAEHRLFNIGAGKPEGLMRLIELLEAALDRPAVKHLAPMQPGDVTATFADISRLSALTGYAPKISLDEGVAKFIAWYRDFYDPSATAA